MLMMRGKATEVAVRAEAMVKLRATSVREPNALPLLVGTIRAAGCWVDAVSPNDAVALQVEVPLRAVVEFYGALIGWGLDLAHESHLAMSGLCTQRLQQRHGFHPLRLRHPVRMTLAVRFVEENVWDVDGFGLA